MEKWCEEFHQLPDFFTGFPRGRGAQDNIATILADIYSAFAQSHHMVACFLDIKSAYDNVSMDILKNILICKSLPSPLINCLMSLCSERSISVAGPNRITRKSFIGLPQESPLSPLLCNLFISDIDGTLVDGVDMLVYADDIVIYGSGANIYNLVTKVERCLKNLLSFLKNKNLSLSMEETRCVLFSRSSPVYVPPIILEGRELEWVGEIRFLGVWLDSKLAWKRQLENTQKACEKEINMLRAISGIDWGSDPLTMLMFYKSFIRPRLEYAGFIYSFCAKFKIQSLERIQNKALRIALGILRTCPIDSQY